MKARAADRAHATLVRNQRLIVEYLQKHPCVDCGESDIRVLDFDHVRGVKVKAVTQLMYDHRPLAVIEAEIAKCDVRCLNCHRKRHADQRPTYRTAEGQNEMSASAAGPEVLAA